MTWQLGQMKEHLGFLVFRMGLFTAHAQVYSPPNIRSPGGPGHGPEGIDINTMTHSIPLCMYTCSKGIQLNQNSSLPLSFLPLPFLSLSFPLRDDQVAERSMEYIPSS